MNLEFLNQYLNTDSPSTFEVEAQKIWIDYVKQFTNNYQTDNYCNAFTVLKTKQSNNKPFKVVLDAHCDEISWQVCSIEENGYIRVKRYNGTDNEITPTTQIKIITNKLDENGNYIKINGVFGTLPIHLKDKTKPTENIPELLYIDVCAESKEEVEQLGIELGNYVVQIRNTEIVNDKYVISKSLDDKIGGFINAEVLRNIVENNIELPFDLYIVNSAQEEVGLRGAKMITDTIKPDIVISFDVTFDASTPNVNILKHGNNKLNDGVIFRLGADVNKKLFDLMKTTADNCNIPYKIEVGGAGGTNTSAYNLSNGGVVTSCVSIPLRYMHTPNEKISLSDTEHAINFLVELLKVIEYNHNFKLI